jgi:hypothetical protein
VSVERAWIDFQDALLGPRVCDLVALLSDSYQEFDADFIEERLDEYATWASDPTPDRLQREFDFVTVSANEDAGRFIFIDQRTAILPSCPIRRTHHSQGAPRWAALRMTPTCGLSALLDASSGDHVLVSKHRVGFARGNRHCWEVVPLYSGGVHYWSWARGMEARSSKRRSSASASSTRTSPGGSTKPLRAKPTSVRSTRAST